MLEVHTILNREGLEVADVACDHPAGRGRHLERASVHALVFVRRGCFVRNVDGTGALLDPTFAYYINPGDEQRFDHPYAHGDDCTSVSVGRRSPRLAMGRRADPPEVFAAGLAAARR